LEVFAASFGLDLLLLLDCGPMFFCLAAFYTGIVLAVASLLG